LYTPLELAGRDLYISEGCYNCHSQMIRELLPEVMRYGRSGVMDDYSHLGESLFDHPFQWGSKRTGPDLAREGGLLAKNPQGKPYKYMRVGIRGNDWHFKHFLNPRDMTINSNMPAYPWLFENKTDIKSLPTKIATQVKLGVPWPAMSQHEIRDMALVQANEIAESLVAAKVSLPSDPQLEGEQLRRVLAEKQVVALIAYVQKLGAHRVITKEPTGPTMLNPDKNRGDHPNRN